MTVSMVMMALIPYSEIKEMMFYSVVEEMMNYEVIRTMIPLMVV